VKLDGLCPLNPHQRGKTPFGNPFSPYMDRTFTFVPNTKRDKWAKFHEVKLKKWTAIPTAHFSIFI
jgi:hypothetical protein